MSQKATSTPAAPSPASQRGAVALLVLALAESALSLYQWTELHKVRTGGAAACNIDQTFNCETVWNTPLAGSLHGLTGIPVAGLGLAWGIVGVALALVLLARAKAAGDVRGPTNGLRLWALTGVAATVVFAGASLAAKALCITCLGTYALVLATAAVAFLLLPRPALPQAGEWGHALGLPAGLAVAALLLLQIPGRATPRHESATDQLGGAATTGGGTQQATAPAVRADTGTGTPLERYLKALPMHQQKGIADGLEAYRQAQPKPAMFPPRRLHGEASAPVKLVEWADPLCPHCADLTAGLKELKRLVPGTRLAIEARQFPLDGQCNPGMGSRGGLRCTAAKGLICLEGTPEYWSLIEQLYANQASLNEGKIYDILTSGSLKRDALDTCIASPETKNKLDQDIAYAKAHDLHGTPLVVVNGKTVDPYLPLLYTLAAVGGDADDPQLRVLPPGSPPQAHQH